MILYLTNENSYKKHFNLEKSMIFKATKAHTKMKNTLLSYKEK